MVSDVKTLTNKGCKIAAQNKIKKSGESINHYVDQVMIFAWLYNKDQEVIQQGSGGYQTRIRRVYDKDQEVITRIFLLSLLLSASVERCFVSCMRDFLFKVHCIIIWITKS